MSRSVLLALFACSFALFPQVDASADTVELRGGGQITGQVVRKPDWVIVKVDDEVQVAIQPSQVIRVVTSDQLQKYRNKVIEAGNDARASLSIGDLVRDGRQRSRRLSALPALSHAARDRA